MMKKKLLFLGLLLASFVTYAQFEVRASSDNSLITNGQTISFSDAGCAYADPCNWKFGVTNTTSNDIYMRIFVENMTNSDGSNFQLCFNGVCLNSVSLYSGYPSTAALIAAGATNSAGNNLWNLNTPGTATAMSWTFRFQAFNSDGMEIGTPLLMTYNYNPTLSLGENQLSEVEVYPSKVINELNVSTTEDLNATIYDLLGRSVKEATILSGGGTIDVSDLTAQPYIIRLTNDEGDTITKKIVKQ